MAAAAARREEILAEKRKQRLHCKQSFKQKKRELELSTKKTIEKMKPSLPPGPLLQDNRKGNRGKEARMRLMIWRSAMEYSRVLYGVNKVGEEQQSPDIGFSGPRRGVLVRATSEIPRVNLWNRGTRHLPGTETRGL